MAGLYNPPTAIARRGLRSGSRVSGVLPDGTLVEAVAPIGAGPQALHQVLDPRVPLEGPGAFPSPVALQRALADRLQVEAGLDPEAPCFGDDAEGHHPEEVDLPRGPERLRPAEGESAPPEAVAGSV